MITRRELLMATGASTLAKPFVCLAQQRKVWRIGSLTYGRSMVGSRAMDAFRAGLRDLGYVDGRNLEIIERSSDANNEESDRLGAELVRLNPDLIMTTAAAVFSVLRAGATMPIVFGFSGDPVVGKLVDSLAHPGRNLTGMSFLSLELVGKRMELVREMLPTLQHVAVIANPQHPGRQAELAVAQSAAKKLGIAIDYFELRSAAELQAVLAGISKARSEAIVVFPDARTMSFSEQIAAFSRKHRIPAISGWTYFADRGNLMSYGPQFEASFRHLAIYVDKILRGTKPADLPVELPTKFELVVNLQTAKALGIKVPPSIVLRADRVIE
jgi:putative ABC transport system substrate-binding protein